MSSIDAKQLAGQKGVYLDASKDAETLMPKQTPALFKVAAVALLLPAAGCHKADQTAGDPADANLAPTSGTVNDSLAGAGSAQQPSAYPSSTAPGQPSYAGVNPGTSARAASGYTSGSMPPPPPEDTPYAAQTQNNPGNAGYADEYAAPPSEAGGAGYEQAAYAGTPPPPLPEYNQPPCPGDNYLWTPGYWNYAQSSYFWVPGVWVVAPFIGALWTPGYWGFEGSRYGFHHGFWGPHIGFYGGINYGYGFFGHGYEGGYWNRNTFEYNRSVTVVNNNIRNVYVHNVSYQNFGNRVAYNGGRGGIDARPAVYEQAAAREQHYGALPAQQQHVEQAMANRAQFAGANGGRPQQLIAARPIGGRTSLTPQAANLRPAPTQGGFERTGAVNSAAERAQAEQQRAQLNQQRATAEQGRAQQNQQRAIENPQNAAGNQARAQEEQQRAAQSQARAQENQNRAQTFAQSSGNRQVQANQQQASEQQQRAQQQQRAAQQQQQRAMQPSSQQVQQQARDQQQRAQGDQQRALEQQQRVQPQARPEPQGAPHSEPAPHAEAPHAEGGGGHGPR